MLMIVFIVAMPLPRSPGANESAMRADRAGNMSTTKPCSAAPTAIICQVGARKYIITMTADKKLPNTINLTRLE